MALSTLTSRIIEIDNEEYVLETEVWEDGVYAISIFDFDDEIIAFTNGIIEDDYVNSYEYLHDAENDLIGSVF